MIVWGKPSRDMDIRSASPGAWDQPESLLERGARVHQVRKWYGISVGGCFIGVIRYTKHSTFEDLPAGPRPSLYC